jgi:hypothetical protein
MELATPPRLRSRWHRVALQVKAMIGGRTDELIDPGGTMRPAVVSSAPSFAMTDVNLHLFEEAAPRW